MKLREITFILPLGYEDDDGMIHRKGKMRMATALDEIEVNNDDRTEFNQRFRDLFMLSRVIINIGDIQNISTEVMENLYEADFIFLQMLYNRLNRNNNESVIVRCPYCNTLNQLGLPNLYENVHHAFAKPEAGTAKESLIKEVPQKNE